MFDISHCWFRLLYLQTETIDLSEQRNKSDGNQIYFGRSNLDRTSHHLIDADGLPFVGQVIPFTLFFFFFPCLTFLSPILLTNYSTSLSQMIRPGEPLYSTYNSTTNKVRTNSLKSSEPYFVDYVATDVKGKRHIQKVLTFNTVYWDLLCYSQN